MATYVWNLVNSLKWISGVACLAIILVAVLKILIGDEQNTKRYITRSKNAIIALVLIFTIVELTNVVSNYFGTDTFTIGSLNNTGITIIRRRLRY